MQSFLRIIAAQTPSQRCQPFSLKQLILQTAVHFLIISLRSVGSPVILQIQLPVPGMHITVSVLHIFVHFPEKCSGSAGLHIWQPRNRIHGTAHGEHFPVDTASSVPVSIRYESIPADVLIPELLPASKNRPRIHVPVIRGEPVRHLPSFVRRVDKICENLRAVDSPPPEQIIGNRVKLVPADFCRHKCINLAELQNLRQRPAVSEHIRQPQILAFLPELPLKKTGAVKELPHQRFPRRDITVGLHPHAAVRLPFSFLYLPADSLIQLRAVLFDILIQLRLRLQKNIIIIFFHQPQHRSKRPLRLLSRMFEPPEPGHVNVGMSHRVNRDIRALLHAGQFIHQNLIRPVNGTIK